MKTRFTPDGDAVVVDGGKIFISNGDIADHLLVFGKWSGIDDPKGAITALLVDKGTPGLSVLRKEEKMGHRAAQPVPLAFDGMRVPRANLLADPGQGLPILPPSPKPSRPTVPAPPPRPGRRHGGRTGA